MEQRSITKYGYIPDFGDFRDLPYVPPTELKVPKSADVFNPKNPILDQGQLGCCTGNGGARILRQEILKQGLTDFAPARLQIYYDERVIEGTVKTDSGAQIRDCLKVLANSGAADEKLWPYVITKFKKKPTKAVYTSALKNKAIQYFRVDNTKIVDLKACLTEGYPIIIGFSVYSEFEDEDAAKTGIVPMPTKSSKLVGGHCVVLEGFDDTKSVWILTNSWGENWGNKGRFTLPYAYLTNTNLATDFWTIRQAS